MASFAEKGAEVFKSYIGKPEAPGEWLVIDQARINAFADCTEDHQFIHVDPETCAKLSPYKVPIAHGFLTLSMLTKLASSIKPEYMNAYEGIMMGVNYGFDKVRFPAPVKVNSKVRCVREISKVDLKNANTIQLTHKCTIEIEGEGKPACVAEWLTNLVYG
jgi:acyl dehydratase